MKKEIHWRKIVVKNYPVKFDCSIRELARKIDEDFTYLSKIFRGYVVSEETVTRILKKIEKL